MCNISFNIYLYIKQYNIYCFSSLSKLSININYIYIYIYDICYMLYVLTNFYHTVQYLYNIMYLIYYMLFHN